MAKILLISGSPRKGNTDFVLLRIFDGLDCEKEFIALRDKNIKHCIGCLSCHDKPECVLKDDMDEIREKMIGADVIVIGTPNYFDNVSGLLKDFIDRTHPFYRFESLKNKKLILIMVGGGGPDGSQKYLDHCTYGFVKYLKQDLIGSYCFQALYRNDLEKDTGSIMKIDNISEKINSLILKK